MALKRLSRLRASCAASVLTAVLVCLGHLLITTPAVAQTAEKPSRKLLYKVEPSYPWDLKRAHIGGIVRMDVIITPRGSVENISVLGGNPILVETALKAVKRWKYAPAENETVLRVNVDFDPSK